MKFNLYKKNSGMSNLTGIAIIFILGGAILLLVAAAGAIVGTFTSDVGTDKPAITADSADAVGGSCDQSLKSKLAEVQMPDATAKISQFGIYGHCGETDPSQTGYAWSSTSPDGCGTSSADYFAAVCTPAPAANCGSTSSWWAKKKLFLTNPANGKTTTVTIIDKGPNIRTGRQLDLSYAAITALGANTDSTIDVCLSGPVIASGGSCSQNILKQAQLYQGVMYSQSGPGGHCGYPTPQGRSGASLLDCSGIISRVYRELSLFKPPSACLSTSDFPSSSNLTQINRSQLQPGDIVDIPGDHALIYVSGNTSVKFNSFSCKQTGVPCGPGTYPYLSNELFFRAKACSASGSN